MYGLTTAATVTVTILCVTIQRRHLMVIDPFPLVHCAYKLLNLKRIWEHWLFFFNKWEHRLLLLQVWALFAPKFVFDVVGLILVDILIFLASLYYHLPNGVERLEDHAPKWWTSYGLLSTLSRETNFCPPPSKSVAFFHTLFGLDGIRWGLH